MSLYGKRLSSPEFLLGDQWEKLTRPVHSEPVHPPSVSVSREFNTRFDGFEEAVSFNLNRQDWQRIVDAVWGGQGVIRFRGRDEKGRLCEGAFYATGRLQEPLKGLLKTVDEK